MLHAFVRWASPALLGLMLAASLLAPAGAEGDPSASRGAIPAAEACRRVAQAVHPPETLVQRCRYWLNTHSDIPGAAEVCRRIASAEQAPRALVERCRVILGQPEAAPERRERPGRPVPVRPAATFGAGGV